MQSVIDVQPGLNAVHAQLHALPSVLQFALLAGLLFLMTGITKGLIRDVKVGWLKPVPVACWVGSFGLIGYQLGDMQSAVVLAAVACAGVQFNIIVRKVMLRIEFLRYVHDQLAEQKSKQSN